MLLPQDQLDELRRQVDLDFEAFSAISLEFKIERVVIEKDDIERLSSIGKGRGREMPMTWVSGNEAMHGCNGMVRTRFSCIRAGRFALRDESKTDVVGTSLTVAHTTTITMPAEYASEQIFSSSVADRRAGAALGPLSGRSSDRSHQGPSLTK